MDFSAVRITTSRLILRPFNAADADAWFRLLSNDALLRYWSHRPWTSPEQAVEDIARDGVALREQHYLRLAIADKNSDKLLGMCIFFSHHRGSARGEIGYLLDPAVQGQGLMHEALVAFIGWLQQQLHIRRLEADIHPDNLASENTLRKLGFVEEGLLRERWDIDGEVSDSKVFGLLLKRAQA